LNASIEINDSDIENPFRVKKQKKEQAKELAPVNPKK